MNNDVFLEWLKHFIQHAKPSQEERVLLILDGHKSHTHNIEALELASKSGVIMLSLPPHTSHRMQPLDLTFFKPLKTYYYQQIEQWLRANPGRAVSVFQICRLFSLAYGKAANVSCAVNGFRKAGIYPVNMLVFDDSDFAAADVTDQPYPAENSDDPIATTSSALVENASSAAVCTTTSTPIANAILSPVTTTILTPVTTISSIPIASTSPSLVGTTLLPIPEISTNDSLFPVEEPASVITDTPACINKTAESNNLLSDMQASPVGLPSSSFYSKKKKIVVGLTVTDISPLPKRIRSMNPGTKRRKSSSAIILTSSPHKNTLKRRENDRPMTVATPKRKRGAAQKTKQKRGRKTENKQNSICLVCGYSADEDWIQCKKCKEWAHEECADIQDAKYYYCDNCS